jgi:hypothetical protein
MKGSCRLPVFASGEICPLGLLVFQAKRNPRLLPLGLFNWSGSCPVTLAVRVQMVCVVYRSTGRVVACLLADDGWHTPPHFLLHRSVSQRIRAVEFGRDSELGR